MKKCIALLLLLLTPLTQAHYVWLETEPHQAKLYFGEWHKNLRENSDKLQRFNSAKIFTSGPSKFAVLNMQENALQAKVTGTGDTRMLLDSLPVKKNRSGDIRKSYYYAKSGLTETQAKLPLELVPTSPNGRTFTLLFHQQPLVRAEIIVYGPPKWEKHMRTDLQGQVSLDTPWAGQYLVKVSHEIHPAAELPTINDPVIKHMYTGTFVVKEGIAWLK